MVKLRLCAKASGWWWHRALILGWEDWTEKCESLSFPARFQVDLIRTPRVLVVRIQSPRNLHKFWLSFLLASSLSATSNWCPILNWLWDTWEADYVPLAILFIPPNLWLWVSVVSLVTPINIREWRTRVRFPSTQLSSKSPTLGVSASHCACSPTPHTKVKFPSFEAQPRS